MKVDLMVMKVDLMVMMVDMMTMMVDLMVMMDTAPISAAVGTLLNCDGPPAACAQCAYGGKAVSWPLVCLLCPLVLI